MTTRRRFTTDFKAKVALESLCGDRTIQEIAARHKVHPHQVSGWKRKRWTDLAKCSRTAPIALAGAMNRKSTIFMPRSAS
jgi:transposase-like protein